MFKKFVIFSFVVFSSYNSFAKAELSLLSDTFIAIGWGKSIPITQIGHYLDENEFTKNYHYKKVKKSDVVSASFGKNFGPIRTEIEYLAFGRKFYTQGGYLGKHDAVYNYSLYTKAYMFNLGYRFTNFNEYNLGPYVNLLAGFSEHELSTSHLTYSGFELAYYNSHKNRAFAKGASLGTLIHLNKHVALDLSYKYLDLGRIKGTKIYNHSGTTESEEHENIKGKLKTNVLMTKLVLKF